MPLKDLLLNGTSLSLFVDRTTSSFLNPGLASAITQYFNAFSQFHLAACGLELISSAVRTNPMEVLGIWRC